MIVRNLENEEARRCWYIAHGVGMATMLFDGTELQGILFLAHLIAGEEMEFTAIVNGNDQQPSLCGSFFCCYPLEQHGLVYSFHHAYALSPYKQSFTIHLNEGWNFISIPLEVN